MDVSPEKMWRRLSKPLQKSVSTPPQMAASSTVTGAPAAVAPETDGTVTPFTGMRRTIAKKMLASKVEAAQAYMGNTIDATRIQELREALLPRIEKEAGSSGHDYRCHNEDYGSRSREHPVINTRWTDKGVLFLPDVHMGMAMALDEGLIVPVIRDINKKSWPDCRRTRQVDTKGKREQIPS